LLDAHGAADPPLRSVRQGQSGNLRFKAVQLGGFFVSGAFKFLDSSKPWAFGRCRNGLAGGAEWLIGSVVSP
jgi:hypothetical protein